VIEPIRRRLRVAPDHPVFAGHFPGRPIVPGVMLLEWVMTEVAAVLGRAPAALRLRESKFFTPLAPGAEAELQCEFREARCTFDIRCESGNVARGVLEWTP
jgi:3-hydroxymyristoyl/3-hydroxydecanoyl-(acyl carrier protein) dehydratase